MYKGLRGKQELKEMSDHRVLKGHKEPRELKGPKGTEDHKGHKVFKEQLEELELRVP